MIFALQLKEIDRVEFAESGACPFGAFWEYLSNFFGDTIFLSDMKVTHELLRNQTKNHNYN